MKRNRYHVALTIAFAVGLSLGLICLYSGIERDPLVTIVLPAWALGYNMRRLSVPDPKRWPPGRGGDGGRGEIRIETH